jgi:hypothetical protein
MMTPEEAHELRVARFNEQEWKRRYEELQANTRKAAEHDKATIRRVWKLVNRRRKTVPMADLRAALTEVQA